MPRKVFHLLSETEAFSEFSGGAISRWAANVLRDDNSAVILCPSADESWRFPAGRVTTMPRFERYERVRRASMYLPWMLRKRVIEYVLLARIKAALGAGDLLWVHNRPDYAVILAPYVHQAGARMVLHLHNSHLLGMPSRLLEQAKIDHFVFVSEYLRNEAKERFPFIASSVLHNGADETLFFPPPVERNGQGIPQVLFASRLVKEKGAHIFLEAMQQLADSGTPAKGVMVGASHFGGSRKTSYIAALQQMAPPNVELRPYCSGTQLAAMFRESDIFCAPATWDEPFGMVNVEAFASRLPVVGTIGGGSKEVFAGGGGLLVDRGSVPQLTAALRTLIASAPLRKKLGDEGYVSFKKNFTWSIVRNRYHQIAGAV